MYNALGSNYRVLRKSIQLRLLALLTAYLQWQLMTVLQK